MMDIKAPVGSIEAKDDFAPAPPGHALTEDNTKWAWGKPQQVVDPEIALEQAINSIKQPKIQLEMIKLLLVVASVEMMVETCGWEVADDFYERYESIFSVDCSKQREWIAEMAEQEE